ncbi:uncharacterized protein [Bemisia tabaci]|uniref:uncharacterized protein n=1 Tax=Bemisia tabaci TaxID=7038 RepID=UPI003B280BDE
MCSNFLSRRNQGTRECEEGEIHRPEVIHVFSYDQLQNCNSNSIFTKISSEDPLGEGSFTGAKDVSFKDYLDACFYTLPEGDLKDQRLDIVRKCVDYLIMRYGYNPSVEQRVNAAKEIVMLYPRFRNQDPSSKGYEHLADPDNYGAGFISNRFKNVKRNVHKKGMRVKKFWRKAKRDRDSLPAKLTARDVFIEDEEFLRAIEVLKAAAPTKDLQSIIDTTLKFAPFIQRYVEANASTMDLEATFPRFYDVKNLIAVCFDQLFPHCSGVTIQNWWNEYRAAVTVVLQESSHNVQSAYGETFKDWSEDIRTFINLAFLFPSREKRDLSQSEGRYEERVVGGLVRFNKSGVPLTECLSAVQKREPFILAEGTSKARITKFFVVVDKHPVVVPETSFFDAIDIMFKSYFLFSIPFNPAVKFFLRFLDCYVYKASSNTATSQMREVYSKLLCKKDELLMVEP